MKKKTMNDRAIAPQILDALRILRDNNPSLARKLESQGSHQRHDTTCTATSVSTGMLLDPPDDSIDYWNKYQAMVVLDQGELVEIHLGGLMVRIINISAFLAALQEKRISSLHTMDLGGTDVGMDDLLLGMKNSSSWNWRKLYLGGCGIGSRKGGISDFVKVMALCPDLNVLDLRYNELSGDDMELLEDILSHKDCKLSVLYLEGNMIQCKGAQAIGKILANNICLREVYLGSNGIGVSGAKALAKGLQENKSLEKLYLEGNRIGDEGGVAFTDVLLEQTKNQSKVLKYLYVDNNGLGKDVATNLGRALNSQGLIDGSFFA